MEPQNIYKNFLPLPTLLSKDKVTQKHLCFFLEKFWATWRPTHTLPAYNPWPLLTNCHHYTSLRESDFTRFLKPWFWRRSRLKSIFRKRDILTFIGFLRIYIPVFMEERACTGAKSLPFGTFGIFAVENYSFLGFFCHLIIIRNIGFPI